MGLSTSVRETALIDGQSATRQFVQARLHRDCGEAVLYEAETRWADARERAATAGIAAGLAPLEHAHWDWTGKADGVKAGKHLLVAIECGADLQGIMAILRTPRPARLTGDHVVYVDYVESAPWNLKGVVQRPQYLGVGTALIVEAVRISMESGMNGAIGLHS